MATPNRELVGELYRLIARLLQGDLATAAFCDAFERIYNLELNRDALTAGEREAFAALFEEVVYYSPFAADRATYPGYRDDAQIRAAVTRARHVLEHPRTEQPVDASAGRDEMATAGSRTGRPSSA